GHRRADRPGARRPAGRDRRGAGGGHPAEPRPGRRGVNRRRPRRVVVKVGSGLIADPTLGPDPARIGPLAAELAQMMRTGIQVALVTSGAIAAGTARLGLGARPRSIPEKQAAAAVGQAALV